MFNLKFSKFKMYLCIATKLIISLNSLLLKKTRTLLFKQNSNPKKILIFRIGSLGDSICAIPSIVSIKNRYPNVELHILTNTSSEKNILSIENIISSEYYDKLIDYNSNKWRTLSRILRAEKYDLVIHLTQQGSTTFKHLRDIIFFRFLAKIPSGVGWDKNTIDYFKKIQSNCLELGNEQSRLARILQQQLGIQSLNGNLIYKLSFNDNDFKVVEDLLKQKVKDLNKSAIAMVIGAKRSTNRWPISYFYETVKQFCSEFNIYIIGGIDDVGLSQPLLSLPNTYSFCGDLTPSQSALLMKKCILTLSNDTGPMHLSYSSGTPVVALFSNRDFPNLWYPPNDGKNIVHRASGISCSLCLLENCPNDNLCMKQIPVDQVVNSLKKITQYSKSGY